MTKEEVVNSAVEFSRTYNPDGLVPFPFDRFTDEVEDVEIVRFEPTNSDISGAIFLENGKYKIVINSVKPEKRQYFTIAHEVGHYWLHREELTDVPESGFIDLELLQNTSVLLRPDEMPTESSALQKEREANTFAAEILMPEKAVRAFYALNGDIEETADAFKVSAAAMAVRLEKLGLV